MRNNELYHYGVLGMKWGKRKAKNDYKSTGLRSALARRENKKIDKSFEKWKENEKKKETAIELGKKSNISRMAYEKNRTNKGLKRQYKEDHKAYKKALNKNTTYRKGDIKREVGRDISRKYLSEAKRVKKQLNNDPQNKDLKKKYNKLMSKHDVERARARKAPEVAQRRSNAKANVKRAMTMTVKAAAATAAVTAGVYAVNKYLSKKNINFKGRRVQVSGRDVENISNFINIGKTILGFF